MTENRPTNNGYIPKTAMFIVAHPDDIEFGMAGTAAKWVQGGSRVIYVVITDGNVGSHENGMTREKLAELRRAEQTAAAEVVGATCIFLGYDDGFLQPTLELRKKLVRLMRQYRPDAVVCMDPTNFFPSDDYINHPDHRAAGQAVLDAVFPAVEMDLLYPDLAAEGLTGYKVNYVYVTLSQKTNCFIDISDTIDLKVEALKKHASQFEVAEAAKMIRTWAVEAGKQVGFDYAETFYRITLRPAEAGNGSQPES